MGGVHIARLPASPEEFKRLYPERYAQAYAEPSSGPIPSRIDPNAMATVELSYSCRRRQTDKQTAPSPLDMQNPMHMMSAIANIMSMRTPGLQMQTLASDGRYLPRCARPQHMLSDTAPTLPTDRIQRPPPQILERLPSQRISTEGPIISEVDNEDEGDDQAHLT